ncbi:hypothetical protein PFNF54_00823, partial [Plasmodium falciparum NF54]
MAQKVGGGGKDDYKDAKDLLDKIGQQVHDKVKNGDAETYKGALKGNLSFATASGETGGTNKPCDFGYDKLISGRGGVTARGDPCGKDGTGKEHRFSKERGAECDKNKISGSNDNEGACAPYRRLSLCNKNFPNMNSKDSLKAKNDLLADVCLAAKHEGNSINTHYQKYQAQYASSASSSQICTMLARSFADIGDIVRGKDLYSGNKKKKQTEREKLENNLKTIFGKIHSDVTKSGNNKDALQERYQKDEKDGNFFQLREDWWYANRATIWEALTCNAQGNTYFRQTACAGRSATRNQCRCDGANIVPTYFDYVPQYLRWFEEWAEDFCRKRKYKLENAKEQCREKDKYYQERYCSGNGYDCTQTVRAQEEYSMENNCHKCFFACNPFVKWLGNQKLEFDKQKKKYTQEIEKYKNGTKQATNGTTNNLYVKDFYDELKNKHENVRSFLELLSKETACQKHPKVEGEGYFDFTKFELNEIFSLTEYCKPCPYCGGKFVDGVFRSEGDEEGKCLRLFSSYVPPEGVDPTEIKVLISGEGHDNINKKLDAFCTNSNDNSLYEKWNCYHDKEGKDKCVWEYDEKDKNKKKVKKFYDFFRFWVTHMLDDSMEWKEKLKGCLKNGTKIKCKNGCKTPCKCFEKWIEQKKKEEWTKIRNHFYTQEGFGQEVGQGIPHYIILEQFLENEYFDGISDAYADPEQMEKIKEKLDEKKKERNDDPTNKETIIDFLLEHEGEDAKKCTNSHNDQECNQQKKQQQQETPARSGTSPSSPRDPNHVDSHEEPDDNDDDSSDEDGEDDVVEEAEEQTHKTTEGTGEGPKETTTQDTEVTDGPATDPSVEVCSIVDKLFSGNDFGDACGTKYDKYGKEKFPNWKCISDSTTKSGAPVKSGGSVCVPPRRRKLYIHDLQSLGVEVDKAPSQEDLLKWFVKSAAVETFFLWDRYKKENTKRQSGSPLPLLEGAGGGEETPETSLKNGTIPLPFLRQMFYTLADYKDILFSGDKDDNTKSSTYHDILKGDKEIKGREEKIQEQLKKFFQNSGNQSPPSGTLPPNSVKDPSSWWKENAQHIWNGMICALTYKEIEVKNPDGKNTYKIEQIQDADKLLGKIKEEKGEYHYSKVTLKDENSGTQAKSNDDTKLENFVERPPFFRWLHEWGSDFCGKRARMLKNVKDNCRSGIHGERYSSGDGENCEKMLRDDYDTVPDLEYRDCVCETLQENAAQFLERLKNGPCKNDNVDDSGKDKTGNSHIKFDDHKTFGHENYCDPCPIFGIESKNSGWSEVTQKTCKDNAVITKDNIKTKIKADQQVVLHVSDNSDHKFERGLDECKEADIFKGIRKEEWECDKLCNSVVCFLKKKNENGTDLKQYIEIRALLKRWVDNFFDDYNKIKHKISHCINSGNKSTCTNDCPNKCKCVRKWIEKKKNEWEEIKKRFNDQYKKENNEGTSSNLNSFLETLIPQTDVDNVIGKVKTLSDLYDSNECIDTDTSKKGQHEYNDVVECLLYKLQKKIDTYNTQTIEVTDPNSCVLKPTEDETYDESPEDDTSTTSVVPEFCEQFVKPEAPPPKVPEIPKEEDKDKRDEEKPASPTDDVDTDSAGTEKLPTPPAPAPVPRSRPKQRKKQKRQITPKEYRLTDVLLPSAFPLSVGIAFVALSYFVLK